MLTRFAVLGDIHVEDVRLEAVFRYLERQRVDTVLCVGDVVDGPGDAERTVGLLRERGVQAVRGNHDRWLLDGTLLPDADRARQGWTRVADLGAESLAWLRAQPPVRTFETARGPLLLCHGVGDDDMVRFRPHTPLEDCDELLEIVAGGAYAFIVAGHSHERMARKCGALWFLNAGTLSRRDRPGFAIVAMDRGAMSLYDVDEEGEIAPAETFRF